MCGVAGWLAFDRDLRTQESTLCDMRASLRLRGPDAEGLWLGRHVGFAHTRLAVVDLPGGKQPMIVEDDHRLLAVVTFSGEIYNHQELRRALEGCGHRFGSRSDTEVVVRAYLEWGDRCPQHFDGMFAFGIWDAQSESLFLARDRLGIKPLFVHNGPAGLVFASEQKAILAHPEITPALNRDGLIECLELIKTPGHGVFEGISEVRPGHTLRVGRGGAASRRYWALDASGYEAGDWAESTRQVRGLLTNAVAQQTVADVPVGALLSGGLDSGVVTALAVERTRAENAESQLPTFSLEFAGAHPSSAVAVDAAHASDLAADLGSSHTSVSISTADLLAPSTRTAVLSALDAPVVRGDFDASLLLMFRAIAEQCTVVLSGEGADELFGGYPWFRAPRSARSFPWFGDDDRARYSMLHPELVQTLDAASYRRDALSDAVASVPQRGDSPLAERHAREMTHLHLTRFLPALLDRKDRLSMACGLEVRVPYCDHRLAELAFLDPQSLSAADGHPKRMLRAATSDLVPSSVTNRAKSPYPVTDDPAYEQRLAQEIRELAADRGRQVIPLVDLGAIDRWLSSVGEEREHRAGVEFVLAFDSWLTRYRPSLRF